MSANLSMLLSILSPCIGALLVWTFSQNRLLRDGVSIGAAIASTFFVAMTFLAYQRGEVASLTLLEVIPGLFIDFEATALGLLFALIASFLWLVSAVYCMGYMPAAKEENVPRFQVCFALSIAAALGIAFSSNLFVIFIFYEMLTLLTYPLVAHRGNEAAKRGARTYLAILLSTSLLFFLPAIIWTWSLTGTLAFQDGGILAGRIDPAFAPLLLALFAFGIGKAALMPFHRWLPAAMVAPAPVSALLHAVAVVKAGVFTLLKVGIFIFGTDYLAQTQASDWLIWLAALSMLLAAGVAMIKTDLKARLAYSTVSQLAYVTLAVALANQAGIAAGSFQLAAHAAAKITLFFCAGAIYVAAGKSDIRDMRGLGRRMPFTFAAFTLASFSLIGMPFFAGSIVKHELLLGALEAGHPLAAGALLAASILAMCYLLPIVVNAFLLSPAKAPSSFKEAPASMLIALCGTALLSLAIGLYPAPVEMLAPLADSSAHLQALHRLTLLHYGLMGFVALSILYWLPRSLPLPGWLEKDVLADWSERQKARTQGWSDASIALLKRVCGPQSTLAGTESLTLMLFAAASVLGLATLLAYL